MIAAVGVDVAATTSSKPWADAVATARWLSRMLLRRDDACERGLFGEPAWTILLDLFVAEADDRRLSSTDVYVGCRAATGTAARYLDMLERQGRIERVGDASDRRRRFVGLTPAGREMMLSLLSDEEAHPVRPPRRQLPRRAAAPRIDATRRTAPGGKGRCRAAGAEIA